MLCGPKGSEGSSISQCAVCGRETELFALPGTTEKYCLGCSLDARNSSGKELDRSSRLMGNDLRA